MAYPTNPSYVRRLVKSMGFEFVRVSPRDGSVTVKRDGKWVSYGSTKQILADAEASHKLKYGKDATKLLATS